MGAAWLNSLAQVRLNCEKKKKKYKSLRRDLTQQGQKCEWASSNPHTRTNTLTFNCTDTDTHIGPASKG